MEHRMTSADQIIHDLVATQRQATTDEIVTILISVAQASFATYLARVPNALRRLLVRRGIDVAPKLSSLEWHLLKRIYVERQWPEDTTAAMYESDLRRAVQHPEVAVWTYRYFGRPYAGFLAPSHVRSAPLPLPYLYVAYDPQYGTITTGYQVSGYGALFDSNCTTMVRHR
jgi:hypothetical protein